MSDYNYESNGFILHSRRFRENSVLLDVLTESFGRVGLLARRSTAKKKTVFNPFQPFSEKLFRWRGRSELQSLQSQEQLNVFDLTKNNLICGLYCNELMINMTARHSPVDSLYTSYKATIGQLVHCAEPELPLRTFESDLIGELGHAINFYEDCETHEPLMSQQKYYYHPASGFSAGALGLGAFEITAEQMVALRAHDLESECFPRAAKLIYASTIQHLLGNKKLASRELFREVRKLHV